MSRLEVVGGLFQNEKDEVLLVRTTKDVWIFPGGKAEKGESHEQTLIREVQEEIGLTNITLGEKYVYDEFNTHDHIPMLFVVYKILGKLDINDIKASNEVEEIKFFSLDEISTLEKTTLPTQIVISRILNS